MAKRKKARKSGSGKKRGPSKAARIKAGKKAARTRKRNEKARSLAAKKGARSAKRKKSKSRKSKSHSAAPRKAPKRRKSKSRKSGKRRKSGSHSKKRRRGGSTRHSHTTRTEIIRLPGHTTKLAVVPVPTPARRGSHKPKRRKSRRKGSKRKSHRARESGYAMENPLSGTELFVGGLTLAIGFAASDFADRFFATHALTDKGTKDDQGDTLYADNPPTDGSYPGLFNATAILAPAWKSPKRLAAGVIGTAAPFAIAAFFVKAPVGRSALQFFGFGYGARFFGKMLIDLIAMATKRTSIGKRCYDAEDRAASMASGSAGYPLTSLPGTGLGAACGCANCKTGIGACCGNMANPGKPNPPPPVPQSPQGQPPHEIAKPPALQTPSSNFTADTRATGAAAPVKRNPYNWGYDDQAAE